MIDFPAETFTSVLVTIASWLLPAPLLLADGRNLLLPLMVGTASDKSLGIRGSEGTEDERPSIWVDFDATEPTWGALISDNSELASSTSVQKKLPPARSTVSPREISRVWSNAG